MYFMLVTCVTICIYLMSLHNYKFTYKSDLCLLISSILYLTIVVVFMIVNINNSTCKGTDIVYVLLLNLAIAVSIVFTALTLVPLCCRAYEDCCYNRESQEGTERNITILHSCSAVSPVYRAVSDIVV